MQTSRDVEREDEVGTDGPGRIVILGGRPPARNENRGAKVEKGLTYAKSGNREN
jgi:hypothetical protein